MTEGIEARTARALGQPVRSDNLGTPCRVRVVSGTVVFIMDARTVCCILVSATFLVVNALTSTNEAVAATTAIMLVEPQQELDSFEVSHVSETLMINPGLRVQDLISSCAKRIRCAISLLGP